MAEYRWKRTGWQPSAASSGLSATDRAAPAGSRRRELSSHPPDESLTEGLLRPIIYEKSACWPGGPLNGWRALPPMAAR